MYTSLQRELLVIGGEEKNMKEVCCCMSTHETTTTIVMLCLICFSCTLLSRIYNYIVNNRFICPLALTNMSATHTHGDNCV